MSAPIEVENVKNIQLSIQNKDQPFLCDLARMASPALLARHRHLALLTLNPVDTVSVDTEIEFF